MLHETQLGMTRFRRSRLFMECGKRGHRQLGVTKTAWWSLLGHGALHQLDTARTGKRFG